MIPSWRRDYLRYKTYFLNVLGRYRDRADIKAYLELLLSLATISVFSIFAFKPTILTIAQLIKEIETKREILGKMDEKIQNLSSAQTLYDRERTNISLLSIAVPDGPNPDIFTRQIIGLSSKYQLTILSVATGEGIIVGPEKIEVSKEEEEKESLEPFPESSSGLSFTVRITVPSEQYSSISTFLTEFERLRRPEKIDSVEVSVSQEDANKALILAINGRLPYINKIN